MKHKAMRTNLIRKITTVAAVVGTVLCIPLIASAANSSQQFNVLNDSTRSGMLMSLTPNAGVVEPASTKNASMLIGVEIPTDATALDRKPGQVSVQNDGQVTALVSNANGDIRVGDRITVSSLVGIGAKLEKSGWTIGTAQASLDAKTSGAISSQVTDNQGRQQTVYISQIPLLVKVSYYTMPSAAPTPSPAVPNALQTAANSIANKHASVLAIVLSFLLLIVVVVFAGIIISSAVRGGLSAIARQPLAKREVTRQMIKSSASALGLVLVGIIGALLLLRIF
jgi:F0F1-type ATP synthase membrane subunit c/vacuolar-type H+-ATPase subunit K